MKRQELLKQYRGVVGKIGFREDEKRKGWMPRLGPHDFRLVIRHGWLRDKPAVLEVSPHLDLVGMARDFKHYQNYIGKP